jgi:hypothetical protein
LQLDYSGLAGSGAATAGAHTAHKIERENRPCV